MYNTKTYLIRISVNVPELELCYKDVDPSFTFDSSEDIANAVMQECGWLSSSGISADSIEEVDED